MILIFGESSLINGNKTKSSVWILSYPRRFTRYKRRSHRRMYVKIFLLIFSILVFSVTQILQNSPILAIDLARLDCPHFSTKNINLASRLFLATKEIMTPTTHCKRCHCNFQRSCISSLLLTRGTFQTLI